MKAWLVLIAAMAFAASPFFLPGFGGFDPELYPIPQIDPPVQPAGWAFSIWGVIYVWLLLHAGLGVWFHASDPIWDNTRLPLAVSLGVGAFWLPVAFVSPVWATVMIFIMLFFALWAVLEANAGGPRWALVLPLGLYAGWLSAASFVSIGLLGAGYGWGFAETGWAVAAVVLATAFALMNQKTFVGVWTYGLAVTWALIAIVAQNFGPQPILAALAAVAALLVAGFTLQQLRR